MLYVTVCGRMHGMKNFLHSKGIVPCVGVGRPSAKVSGRRNAMVATEQALLNIIR